MTKQVVAPGHAIPETPLLPTTDPQHHVLPPSVDTLKSSKPSPIKQCVASAHVAAVHREEAVWDLDHVVPPSTVLTIEPCPSLPPVNVVAKQVEVLAQVMLYVGTPSWSTCFQFAPPSVVVRIEPATVAAKQVVVDGQLTEVRLSEVPDGVSKTQAPLPLLLAILPLGPAS